MSASTPPLPMRALQILGTLYDHDLGWLLRGRFLRLTHTGRRSGRAYHVMLEVLGSDVTTGEVFVLAGFGEKTDWYRNVLQAPALVELGRTRLEVSARRLSPAQARAVFVAFERRHRWVSPLLKRALSWLIGQDYDGSEPARTQLLRERPIVAFHKAVNCTDEPNPVQ